MYALIENERELLIQSITQQLSNNSNDCFARAFLPLHALPAFVAPYGAFCFFFGGVCGLFLTAAVNSSSCSFRNSSSLLFLPSSPPK